MTIARRSGPLTLAVLGATGAATDVIGYLGLGRVFPANMTGNTVLLGISIATGDRDGFAGSATALLSFLAAVVAAGSVLPGRTIALLIGEAGLLAVFGLWSAAAPTGATARFGLIVLAAAAMGIQSTVILHIGTGGVTTTYITGMWTGLIDAAGAGLRRRITPMAGATTPPGQPRRQALVILTYAATACVVAVGYTAWPRWWVVAPAVLVVAAVVGLVRGR